MSIKGYNAMNEDMTCRKFKFTVGQEYTVDKLEMCNSGFHFCKNLLDVYNYYPKTEKTIICEIEAFGEVLDEGDKSVTRQIKIVRQLSYQEILGTVLKNNNSGNRNSGDGNSGNRNSGGWNSGDGNSGYFNTEIPLYFFNKPSNIKYTNELGYKIRNINVKPILQWVDVNNMTEEEKTNNPSSKVTGGFLRSTGRHDWRNLTDSDKEFIKSLPNYDDEIFQKISNGVSLLEEMVEVTVKGVVKKIKKEDAEKLGLV